MNPKYNSGDIIEKTYVVKYSQDDEGGYTTLSGIASTEAIDRVGDEVIQDWDWEEYLKQNPVLLYNHDMNMVIGHATELASPPLQYKAVWASDENELARTIKANIREGHYTGKPGEALTSVRFRSGEVTETETGYKFAKNKLMELSVVSMPANLGARAQAKGEGVVVKCAHCKHDTPALAEPNVDAEAVDEPSARPEAASALYRCLKETLDALSKYLNMRGGH